MLSVFTIQMLSMEVNSLFQVHFNVLQKERNEICNNIKTIIFNYIYYMGKINLIIHTIWERSDILHLQLSPYN